MHGGAPETQFGESEAQTLLDRGWRQGQIFRPTPDLPELALNEEGVYFVVCTQTCCVVSKDLKRDPWVEVAVGRPVSRYNPRSHQAVGKDVRKYHLPVVGAEFEALEIDINSRRFVDRQSLLKIDLGDVRGKDGAERNFAGWIARYYSRIALPNELVKRLHLSILGKLDEFLKQHDHQVGGPRHLGVPTVWIKWDPNAELENDKFYAVSLMFLCEDEKVAERYDRDLIELFGENPGIIDGIKFDYDVNSPKETRLSDLDGWQRFTDWDHFTGLGEVAAVPV